MFLQGAGIQCGLGAFTPHCILYQKCAEVSAFAVPVRCSNVRSILRPSHLPVRHS